MQQEGSKATVQPGPAELVAGTQLQGPKGGDTVVKYHTCHILSRSSRYFCLPSLINTKYFWTCPSS